MDKAELQEIIAIIEKTEIDILHVEKGDFKLYYQKNGESSIRSTDFNDNTPVHTITNKEENNDKQEQVNINKEDGMKQIVSPMIGTYYGRPEQGEDPFVKQGDQIKQGQTVCMLEAMKLFNEVRSELEGEIIEIHAQDGDIIEYGQPLFTVKVSE